MGIGSNFVRKTFSGPAYDRYVTDLSRAELVPTTFDYNIDANKAAGNFIQDRISQTFGDNPISRGLGEIATYGAVPGAFLASPFHEAAQVIAEDKLKDYALPYSGDFANFTKAMLDQRVPQTMAERAGGVLQSTNLGQGIFDLAGKTQDIVSGIRQRNPGVTGTDYFGDVDISQPPGTDVGIMSNLANLFGSSAMANEPMSIEDFQVQNIKDRPIASVPSNFLNYRFQNARTPFTPVREGITSLKDKLGTIKDKGIDVGRMALSGIGRFAAGPIGGILGSIIGSVKESPEQRAMRDFYGNEFGLDDIGRVQSGVMKGYSPVSLFGGVGLNQAIDKRIAKINQTLAKQKKNRSKVLENRLKELKELRAKESAAASAALEAQRMGRRPSAPSGDGAKDSGGPTGGYSYDSGGRQGFGYGL